MTTPLLNNLQGCVHKVRYLFKTSIQTWSSNLHKPNTYVHAQHCQIVYLHQSPMNFFTEYNFSFPFASPSQLDLFLGATSNLSIVPSWNLVLLQLWSLLFCKLSSFFRMFTVFKNNGRRLIFVMFLSSSSFICQFLSNHAVLLDYFTLIACSPCTGVFDTCTGSSSWNRNSFWSTGSSSFSLV